MQDVWHFFTSNQLFVSLANIGGVLGLVILAWTTAKAVISFGMKAWRTSIAAAIRDLKKKRVRVAVVCARDLHIYVSVLALRAGVCFLYLLPASLTAIVQSTPPSDTVIYRYIITPNPFGGRHDDLLSVAAALFVLLAAFSAISVGILVSNVLRLRPAIIRLERRSRLRKDHYLLTLIQRPGQSRANTPDTAEEGESAILSQEASRALLTTLGADFVKLSEPDADGDVRASLRPDASSLDTIALFHARRESMVHWEQAGRFNRANK